MHVFVSLPHSISLMHGHGSFPRTYKTDRAVKYVIVTFTLSIINEWL